MNIKRIIFTSWIVFISSVSFSQVDAKGNLFIIGGGDRSAELMNTLIRTAGLGKKDHIAILPMSSSEPDTSYYYIKIDFEQVCRNTIACLNFTKDKVNDKTWLDSLKKAKIIFITGGDQSRFMNAVLDTQVYDAIHEAYKKGATIAGSSAGAAVMTKQMITGNQLIGDTTYYQTFSTLQQNNLEIKEGLALLDSAIIDQHFVARSRYNRLLTAIEKFPTFLCIGIDEATAIIVHETGIYIINQIGN